MRLRCLAFALLAALALPSPNARAHGGLPVSETIFIRGDTLIVPTQFWGVFMGPESGPWRWICEEAINKKQDRKWALPGDRPGPAPDNAGVPAPRAGGCTWIPPPGEISTPPTANTVAAPADPKRAWSTTDEGSSAAW